MAFAMFPVCHWGGGQGGVPLFNGATNSLARSASMLNVTNGRQGILFFSAKWSSGVVLDAGGVKVEFLSDFLGDARISVTIKGTVLANLIVDATQTSSVFDAGEWGVFLMTWDMDLITADRLRIYINDQDENLQIILFDGGKDVSYGRIFPRIGVIKDDTSGLFFSSCMEKLYLNTSDWLDITVASNRHKFYNADLTAKSLGDDGSTPTGNQPTLYFFGSPAQFPNNLGDGGDFALQGDALGRCGTNPTDSPPDS